MFGGGEANSKKRVLANEVYGLSSSTLRSCFWEMNRWEIVTSLASPAWSHS